MRPIKKGSKGQKVKQIQEKLNIEVDGIFGPLTEQAVIDYQKKNGLEADGIVGPITWDHMFGSADDNINITDGSIKVHITRLKRRPLKYIAIHYTAGSTSKKGAAMATRRVFLKRNASADFVVDDATIVQINPDIRNYYCWAVGDRKNPYSNGAKLYGKAKNTNTISIEICSNLKSGRSAKHANTDAWYYTDKALNNTIKLVKYLMKEYDIPIDNVVRHYDISGKICPGIIGWNDAKIYDDNGNTIGQNNSDEWNKFIDNVKNAL